MSKKRTTARRRICFVTGTRAEFGLMRTTLKAVQAHPSLQLQIIATGMHLDRSRGSSVEQIAAEGFQVHRIVAWSANQTEPTFIAASTGKAITGMALALEELKPDIVIVVGDRVEAFAAAAAGQIGGRIVAHVHGGDRALGQVDDALRHAITKLSHVHFAATAASRERIIKLGEEPRSVHLVGAPGIDAIASAATTCEEVARRFRVQRDRLALIVYHPSSGDDEKEAILATRIATETLRTSIERIVIVCPNNDPGSAGIMRAWKSLEARGDPRVSIIRDLPRADFLGLLRDARALIGNSSSGIIEAASFSTPVLDIGPRQLGRERSANVLHVEGSATAVRRGIGLIIDSRTRAKAKNVYGGTGTGQRIAEILANVRINEALRRKLITY